MLIAVLLTGAISACAPLTDRGDDDVPAQGSMQFDNTIKQFTSEEEMEAFLGRFQEGGRAYYGTKTMATQNMADSAAMDESARSAGSDGGYAGESSSTNVQVEGVDEADIVKNDGKYIYYVTNNMLYIVEAYPAEDMDIVAELEIKDGYPDEIFIKDDRLVIMGRENREHDSAASRRIGGPNIMPMPNYKSYSFVKIYDISDKEEPELEESISLEGSYFDARLVGDHAYVIFNKHISDGFYPPVIYMMDGQKEIAASDISYVDSYDSSHELSIILSVDLNDASFTEETLLKGTSQDMYVSDDSIYLVNSKDIPYTVEEMRIIEEVYMEVFPDDVVERIEEIMDYDIRESSKISEIEHIVQKYVLELDEDEREDLMEDVGDDIEEIRDEIAKERDKTVINRIAIDEDEIKPEASGEVKGRVINQFSMDEHDDHFRIATTSGNMWDEDDPSSNNLYVLDMDLEAVGKIEEIAPREQIYSVRFMQGRAYMVTFRNVDPLFVIDVEDPEEPEILGKLKIPGFSNYLHPYNETLLIGIGKEVTVDEKEDRATTEGVKIALFDVSDVENPKEIAKEEIGDSGSHSEALYDHKAVLFDREKELFAFPVEVREEGDEGEYSDITFSGLYIYTVNGDGFDLRGKVSHFDEEDYEKSGYYLHWNKRITRSLYMDDVIYTLSQRYIQAHDLEDIDEIEDLELFKEEDEPEVIMK